MALHGTDHDEPMVDMATFVVCGAAELEAGGRLSVHAGRCSCELPRATAQAVIELLRKADATQEISLVDLPRELTTGQAADLLGVSRPTVVKLVEDGHLPASRVRNHRRLRTDDVLAYRDRVRHGQGRALDELTELSQELGLYDDDS